MKDGQAGDGIKARRRHVEIVPNADHIGVRVVRVDNRVAVCAVAIIGDPNLRKVLRMNYEGGDYENQRGSERSHHSWTVVAFAFEAAASLFCFSSSACAL